MCAIIIAMLTPDRPLRILFVCTANVCRSPLAAGFMAKHARLAGAEVAVSSASIEDERRKTHPLVVAILGEHGLRLGRTESLPLSGQLVDEADLILTMTAQHAISVAGRFRDARSKVFMLADFVEGVRRRGEQEPLDQWLADVRRHARLYPAGPDPRDVLDPIGTDELTFRNIAAQLDDLTHRMAVSLRGAPTRPA